MSTWQIFSFNFLHSSSIFRRLGAYGVSLEGGENPHGFEKEFSIFFFVLSKIHTRTNPSRSPEHFFGLGHLGKLLPFLTGSIPALTRVVSVAGALFGGCMHLIRPPRKDLQISQQWAGHHSVPINNPPLRDCRKNAIRQNRGISITHMGTQWRKEG